MAVVEAVAEDEPLRARPVPGVVAASLVFVAVFVLLHLGEVRSWLMSMRAWMDAWGAAGPVALALVYAVGVVCFVPGNVMTPVAVALLGPWMAIPVVSIGGTLGATAAFLIARHGLRDFVAARMARWPRFRWLEEHTATRGPLCVAIARILPVMPASFLHYAFGVTRVTTGVFIFWSWLCSLPGLVFFVTGLDTVFRLATSQPIPPPLLATLAIIIVVKVFLITWAARTARATAPSSRA